MHRTRLVALALPLLLACSSDSGSAAGADAGGDIGSEPDVEGGADADVLADDVSQQATPTAAS